MTPRITMGGLSSLILAHDGVGINFSKIVLGNGEAPEDYKTLENMQNSLYEVEINSITRDENNSYVELQGVFSNQNVDSAFEWTEVGIFCTNAFSTQEEPLEDVLYAYAHYKMSEELTAGATVPKSGQEVFEILLKYRIYVGELENVTATIAESSNYASKAELENHIYNQDNPHNVTADQLGIDAAFLNGTVDELQVTIEDASTTEAIENGDNMATAFGKISKAIKDLIAHITNRENPHGVTASQVGAAAASHNHSASNINSGTLSVVRGGTGVASATAGALLKGNGTSAFAELSGTGAVYASTKNSPAFGTLPVSCGGTGNTSVDITPTANSTKMCTSGGIKTALDTKAASSHNHGAGNITSGTLPVARGGTGRTDLTFSKNGTVLTTAMLSYNSTTKTLTITTT